MDEQEKINGLDAMRKPFEPHQISKLPKPYKKDSQKGTCPDCGGYHALPAMHLSYVGHAALTDRLLDVDPAWAWEPVSFDERGLPALDKDGGLWIRLTVLGVTRLGYGDAQGKTGGDAMKERIGDALRNAAMRFGAALDLWHKGILHLDDEPEEPAKKPAPKPADTPEGPVTDAAVIAKWIETLEACKTPDSLMGAFADAWRTTRRAPAVKKAYDRLKVILEVAPA